MVIKYLIGITGIVLLTAVGPVRACPPMTDGALVSTLQVKGADGVDHCVQLETIDWSGVPPFQKTEDARWIVEGVPPHQVWIGTVSSGNKKTYWTSLHCEHGKDGSNFISCTFEHRGPGPVGVNPSTMPVERNPYEIGIFDWSGQGWVARLQANLPKTAPQFRLKKVNSRF